MFIQQSPFFFFFFSLNAPQTLPRILPLLSLSISSYIASSSLQCLSAWFSDLPQPYLTCWQHSDRDLQGVTLLRSDMAFCPESCINLNDAYSEHLSQQWHCSCSLHICDILLSSYIAVELVGKQPALLQPNTCSYSPKHTRWREGKKRLLTRRKERSRLCSMLVISRLPITTSQFS